MSLKIFYKNCDHIEDHETRISDLKQGNESGIFVKKYVS